ncbi:MAG: hypothetical protein JWN18_529 [Parcubacteria group bacterium]|nr:hypothetical protein [Parcubacteria group bacterium]
MKRTLIVLSLFLFLIPAIAFAATPRNPTSFSAAQSLLATSSALGNAFVAGTSVVVTAPVFGDFSAIGGSIVTAAPVSGDDLLLGGSVRSRATVGGDVRAAGGGISIDEPVAGDLVAFGYSVVDAGRAGGSVFIAALNTTITDGAGGPVTIYGNNISLAGDFAGSVHIVAGGRVTLAASTTISGSLFYEAPEPANIPTSVVISGGVKYTNASYLPNVGTSRILALVSVGFFLFARILGALILAGLLAGLFPRLAEEVVNRAHSSSIRSILLTTLLGFGIFVATPILLVTLLLTFVGIGLAFLLLLGYALLFLFALLYAGILLGGALTRRYMKRDHVLWHDGVLGMLLFSAITLVPIIGLWVALLLALYTAGTLLQLFYAFAFPHERDTRVVV